MYGKKVRWSGTNEETASFVFCILYLVKNRFRDTICEGWNTRFLIWEYSIVSLSRIL